MAVSKEFAPPFKLIAPFFVAGILFYLFFGISSLFFDIDYEFMNVHVAGAVHLFLLGYVMMIIFGAMAQLVPVVLETGHFSVDLYYVIFPLLAAGAATMVIGFWFWPVAVGFGGLLVLISMLIFSTEVLLTIKKSTITSNTLKSVKIANIFLLIGIVSGFLLATTVSGIGWFDMDRLLKVHVYAVLGGYVMITVMGISMILLPMFGLSHGFDEKPFESALKIMTISVVAVILGGLTNIDPLAQLGYIGSFAATGIYLYQIFLIYKTRARKENDIWFFSVLTAYISLAIALICGFLYLLSADYRPLLYGAVWLFFIGFLGFLINGHLFKIVPFLVWFHKYSDKVGKERVPMLSEMYPKKSAYYQFGFSLAAAVLGFLALLGGSGSLFKAAAAFLFVGAVYMALALKWMLKYPNEI